MEAEAAVLGCVLLDATLFEPAVARLCDAVGQVNAFYDLRHQIVFQAMIGLNADGKMIDSVTLHNRLRDSDNLDKVGGSAFIDGLMAAVPTGPSGLESHLEILCEKKLARQALRNFTHWAGSVWEGGSLSEGQLQAMQEDMTELIDAGARQLARDPEQLVSFDHFGEGIYNWWFRQREDEHGFALPFEFPMRIRPSEMTVFNGDNGSGKSSILGQICIVLAKDGAKPLIASMEVPGEVTGWIMSRQLLGLGPHLEETTDNVRKVRDAVAWMAEKMLVYDFKGIANWQELLRLFEWAVEKRGCNVFVVDSVMRIGITEDDYAQQALAAKQFADFALKRNVHLFLVMHDRKGTEGNAKERVAGSKKWTDNAHNVCTMRRNEKKSEKLAELKESLKHGEIDQEEHDKEVGKLRIRYDAKFVLSKQRFPGSQQNASRHLWFHHPSLQFHVQPDITPWCYFE